MNQPQNFMLILGRFGTIVMLIMKKVQKYTKQQWKWKSIIKNFWDKILQRNSLKRRMF